MVAYYIQCKCLVHYLPLVILFWFIFRIFHINSSFVQKKCPLRNTHSHAQKINIIFVLWFRILCVHLSISSVLFHKKNNSMQILYWSYAAVNAMSPPQRKMSPPQHIISVNTFIDLMKALFHKLGISKTSMKLLVPFPIIFNNLPIQFCKNCPLHNVPSATDNWGQRPTKKLPHRRYRSDEQLLYLVTLKMKKYVLAAIL